MATIESKRNLSASDKTVRRITIEIPGPVEPFDAEESWDWPEWPKGPVGASQTGGRGVHAGRAPGEAGLNPMYYTFATSRTLLQQMRDPPPAGRGVPVYPHRYLVTDEGEMARNIKATARYLGADLVGIVKLTPEKIKLAAYRKDQEAVSKFSHYIIVAKEMEPHHFRSRLIHPNFRHPVRAPSASGDVHKSYSDVEKMCVHLADYIRGLGYNAESQGPSRRLLNGPFANWAGLGETGRNNTVITPEFGPRVRLGGVLTDLPMTEDQPRDLGVQAFCEVCKACVRACASGAITKGPKQLVRGVLRWPLNRKRCSEVGWQHGGDVAYGCQQCLIVCPFNKPPGLLHDMVRWSIKRTPWLDPFFVKMGDLMPSSYEKFLDYSGREKGEKATLGLWPELWHEKGWVDDYTPPARPETRPPER
ncbi:MAG: 4Fe-4S dicluster domain-containing protein [Chloroflexi bacterium]|nr:4Fe-4S dicluster domain-containing protein [Chloroflexota bacterium]